MPDMSNFTGLPSRLRSIHLNSATILFSLPVWLAAAFYLGRPIIFTFNSDIFPYWQLSWFLKHYCLKLNLVLIPVFLATLPLGLMGGSCI
ncbi:MAG: hypothetical protein PHQ23_14515, partial [Candidatus Wallbacteria bacterium]|nr:hypothetical protein [Candidatus Wallbacteria bacterium]